MLLPRLFVDIVNMLLIYSADFAVSGTTDVVVLMPQVMSLMVKWMRRGPRGRTSRRQGEHLAPLLTDEAFLSTNKISPATKGIPPRVRLRG